MHKYIKSQKSEVDHGIKVFINTAQYRYYVLTSVYKSNRDIL